MGEGLKRARKAAIATQKPRNDLAEWKTFHGRAHRPAIGGAPAAPFEECEALDCARAREMWGQKTQKGGQE